MGHAINYRISRVWAFIKPWLLFISILTLLAFLLVLWTEIQRIKAPPARTISSYQIEQIQLPCTFFQGSGSSFEERDCEYPQPAQVTEQGEVLLVIVAAGHDRAPLSAAARKHFDSNFHLAYARANEVIKNLDICRHQKCLPIAWSSTFRKPESADRKASIFVVRQATGRVAS